jgi:dolichyl-phosphate beta-glucosyltransferase
MSPEFFSYLYTRHLLSRLFNLLVMGWLGLKVRDCQAGLKGFRREAADLIFPRLRLDGFAFDVEVLYIAKRFNLEIR